VRVPATDVEVFLTRVPAEVRVPAKDSLRVVRVVRTPEEVRVPAKDLRNALVVVRTPEEVRVPAKLVDVFLTRVPAKVRVPE
jgi:hypothetical protein